MIKSFIDNPNVNLFNIHAAIIRKANDAGQLFGPIYFYQSGFPLWQVFVIFGCLHLGRIPFRLLSGRFINWFGMNWAMFVGAVGMGASYYFISFIEGLNTWFWLYTLFFVVFQPIFWLCNHLMFAVIGNPEKRGRQKAVLETLQNGLGVIFPILSALIIMQFSYHTYYLIVFAMIILSFIPIIFMEEPQIPTISFKDNNTASLKSGFPWYLHCSMREVYFYMTWTFVILLASENDLVITGIFLAVGVLAQIIWQAFLGHSIDAGAGKDVSRTSFLIYLAGSLTKCFLPLNIFSITSNEVFQGLSKIYTSIVLSVAVYNSAQKDTSPYWFFTGCETGWDVGTFLACMLVAIGLYFGVSLQLLILLSIPSAAILWRMNHKYYHNVAASS